MSKFNSLDTEIEFSSFYGIIIIVALVIVIVSSSHIEMLVMSLMHSLTLQTCRSKSKNRYPSSDVQMNNINIQKKTTQSLENC